MDKNKQLCELLGIPWHEYKWDQVPIKLNPDFTSDAGKVMLLREMQKRLSTEEERDGSFWEFIYHISQSPISPERVVMAEILLDTTGKLRDKCIEFLEGRKG